MILRATCNWKTISIAHKYFPKAWKNLNPVLYNTNLMVKWMNLIKLRRKREWIMKIRSYLGIPMWAVQQKLIKSDQHARTNWQGLVSPGLWGFQLLPPILVRFLHKNKHGQRKFWYFVLRPNDGPQKTTKVGTFKLKFLVYLMNKSARVWRNVYNFTKDHFISQSTQF